MRLSEIDIPKLKTTIKEGTWIKINHAFDGMCDYQVLYMDDHPSSPIMFLRPYGIHNIKSFATQFRPEDYKELTVKYGEDVTVEFTHPDSILEVSSRIKTLKELLREL